MPTHPAATPNLPLSRAERAILKPSPSAPRRASGGRRQFSKKSSAVLADLRPSLPFISFVVKPGAPFSTMKAATFLCPSSGLVRAKTMSTSALPPVVIHVFVPLGAHPSFFRVAIVFIEAASLPAPGSVRAKAPSSLPLQRPGIYLSFCSSVPHFKREYSTRESWTERIVLREEQPLPTSSRIMAWEM